jgi:hypothetical protein
MYQKSLEYGIGNDGKQVEKLEDIDRKLNRMIELMEKQNELLSSFVKFFLPEEQE